MTFQTTLHLVSKSIDADREKRSGT